MIRWVLTIFVALVVFSALLPWLEKLGVGRLPGDLRFKLFGKTFFLPFASTVLLSLCALLLARFSEVKPALRNAPILFLHENA